MTKYRTLEEVIVDGVGVGANNDIELTEEQAAALEGKVEVVSEGTPAEPSTPAPADEEKKEEELGDDDEELPAE